MVPARLLLARTFRNQIACGAPLAAAERVTSSRPTPSCPQQLVDNWQAHTLAQQRQAFGAALVAAERGGWDQLEARLRLALELAA